MRIPKRTAIAATALVVGLAGCADNAPLRSNNLQLGMQLYHQGEFKRARGFLIPAYRYQQNHTGAWSSQKSIDRMHRLGEVIAETYWQQGDDDGLIKFAATSLPHVEANHWWCRILQRRGHLSMAEKCDLTMGDARALKQAYLTQNLLNSMLGPHYRFGYRPSASEYSKTPLPPP